MCIHLFGSFHPPAFLHLPLPPSAPCFQAEPVQPFSLILLKRKHKQ
jgi:hypothetical protein